MEIKRAVNYLSCFPIAQQVVGGSGFIFGVGSLAYHAIASKKELRTHFIQSDLRLVCKSLLRCIPVIGTIFSIFLLKKESLKFEEEKNRYHKIEKQSSLDTTVTMGQGEYIVFSENTVHLNKEIFNKCYSILREYNPRNLKPEQQEKRQTLILEKIKEIDPNLNIAFIPRALYEMTYIEQCIKEDMKASEKIENKKQICKVFFCHKNQQEITKEIKEEIKNRKCWHLAFFNHEGNDQNKKVQKIAYRLNQKMVKLFKPKAEGFSLKEILDLGEKRIDYLKDHGNKGHDNLNLEHSYPTINFLASNDRHPIKSMKIRNDKDAEIIRKCITLECSKKAVHSLFIYRGATFKEDEAYAKNQENSAYSLSYGSGLFAGVVFDGGATAYKYMREAENAFAIPIRFNELDKAPFYVPKTGPIPQLLGCGETFHARSKEWKNGEQLKGINPFLNKENQDDLKLLKSDKQREELIKDFKKYKKKAIQLK